MIEIEEQWFASGEITLEVLMDRVGRAIADWVLADLGEDARDSNVLALVGKGNNGGDAVVAAKYLLESGVPVTLATVLPRDDNDPLMLDFVAAGGTVVELGGTPRHVRCQTYATKQA